eukprot:SAG22_NODE_1277_length_4907_cov_2.638311_7_plen_102_part_00
MAEQKQVTRIWDLPAFWVGVGVAAGIESATAAEQCNFFTFNSLPDIVDICCDNAASGTCAEGFPLGCSVPCATSLVPFYEQCSDMVGSFPDETFDGFHLQQ